MKSDGFRVFPHVLHFPSWVRKISLIGLRLITFDIVEPQNPQTTSVKGYDINNNNGGLMNLKNEQVKKH